MSLRQWWHKRARREDELDEEIQAHLRMAERDRTELGETPNDARAHVRREFGNVLLTKEVTRAQWGCAWIDPLILDLRFAVRQLRKSGGFTATAVLVLSLGMCASIAIFAFVDAVLIKPLPYPNPTRLVEVTESAALFPRANLSYPDYQDWKRFNTVFRSFDVFTGDGFLFDAPKGAEPTYAGRVSSGFFRTLGVQPLLGRDFLAVEEAPGGPRVVVLSYRTWRQRLGGRKDVVGQGVRLSGELYNIVGVLPPDFQFAPLGASEFWTTIDPK